VISFKEFLLTEAKDVGIKAEKALFYAMSIGKRSHAVERTLLKAKDHHLLFDYAKYVVKGRWKEVEPEIFSLSAWQTLQYVEKVVKDRLPEAEEVLSKSKFWSDYLGFLSQHDSNSHTHRQLELVKERGLTDDLFDALNNHYMSDELQEYICKVRPDLVGKIYGLSPELTQKYQHEKELGNVDL
jgi:hypothetical protein